VSSRGAPPLPDAQPAGPTGLSGESAAAASWFRDEAAGTAMALGPVDTGKVVNRLRRAQGQLAGVVRMLDEGRDCEDIVTQISAVSRALDRAGFAVVASGMRQCLTASDGNQDVHVRTLERVFLSLA